MFAVPEFTFYVFGQLPPEIGHRLLGLFQPATRHQPPGTAGRYNAFFNPPISPLSQYFLSGVGKIVEPGNTKGGSITVPLTSCLTGLESAV